MCDKNLLSCTSLKKWYVFFDVYLFLSIVFVVFFLVFVLLDDGVYSGIYDTHSSSLLEIFTFKQLKIGIFSYIEF